MKVTARPIRRPGPSNYDTTIEAWVPTGEPGKVDGYDLMVNDKVALASIRSNYNAGVNPGYALFDAYGQTRFQSRTPLAALKKFEKEIGEKIEVVE